MKAKSYKLKYIPTTEQLEDLRKKMEDADTFLDILNVIS